MRKFLIIAGSVLAAATAAVPATAQYGQGYGYQQGRDIGRQLQNLDMQIRRAADRGRISPREADRLLRQVDRLEFLFARYRRDGLSRWEHQDLQNRIHNLRQRLQFNRWDDRRDDRRWDRDDDRDDDRWDRRRGRDRDDDDDDD